MTKKQKNLLIRIILGVVLFLAGMILERVVEAPWGLRTAVALLLLSWLLCGLEDCNQSGQKHWPWPCV